MNISKGFLEHIHNSKLDISKLKGWEIEIVKHYLSHRKEELDLQREKLRLNKQ